MSIGLPTLFSASAAANAGRPALSRWEDKPKDNGIKDAVGGRTTLMECKRVVVSANQNPSGSVNSEMAQAGAVARSYRLRAWQVRPRGRYKCVSGFDELPGGIWDLEL